MGGNVGTWVGLWGFFPFFPFFLFSFFPFFLVSWFLCFSFFFLFSLFYLFILVSFNLGMARRAGWNRLTGLIGNLIGRLGNIIFVKSQIVVP